MELDAYRDVLEFYPEYQLTSEPLRIDCVVIKKAESVRIEKNIAATISIPKTNRIRSITLALVYLIWYSKLSRNSPK